MRGIMISMAVLFFVLSVSLVNEMEASHFAETNRTIYGFSANPPYTATDLEVLQDDEIADTLEGNMEPKEQPGGITDAISSTIIYPLKLAKFVYNVLFNTTFGLKSFIQNLGRPGLKVVPSGIATVIALGVNLSQVLVILQIVAKSLKEGI